MVKIVEIWSRRNPHLISDIDEHALDEDVRKELLALSEEKHDEKREALAVFNNKVHMHWM